MAPFLSRFVAIQGLDRMNKKIYAIAATVLLMAVVAFSVVQTTDDSEATRTLSNNTTVFLIDGTTVSSTTLYSYDLYQALVSASTTSGFALNGITTTQKTVTYEDGATVVTQNSSWNQKIHTGYTQTGDETYYYNPNEDYGTLASVTVGETSYTNFNVYIYQKETNGTTYSWETPLSAIGWYHPFADYSATYTAASGSTYSLSAAAIAITVNDGSCNSITSTIDPPVTIDSSTSNCLYTFMLKGQNATAAIGKSVIIKNEDGDYVTTVLTSTNLTNGITIYGWGSNAHEALMVALCGQTDVQTKYAIYHTSTYGDYYTYYGWYDEILDTGTQTIINPDGTYTYHWWQTSTVTGTSATATDYSLSYYSGLSGAPNAGTTFQVEYV